jgi:hypothetical protein
MLRRFIYPAGAARTHAERVAAATPPQIPVVQQTPGAILEQQGADQAPSPHRQDASAAAFQRLATIMGWGT